MSFALSSTKPSTTSVPSTGYDDVDNLNNAQNELYGKAYDEQKSIINTQTQQAVDEINRNKDKLNEETTKQNQALYTDYTKQVNPYGTTAEGLAASGLANSGVSESTKVNLYNSYQKNRTDTLNTAKSLLADYDAQITKARQNGDIQLAQAALEMYNQKIENLYRTYQLTQSERQFEYQKSRDTVSDEHWQKEYDYNKSVNDRSFYYQKNRDDVADKQWQQQYDYNKSVDDRNYNYQVSRDTVADNQWQKQYDYNKSVDDRNYNYQVKRDDVGDSQWEKSYELEKKNLNSASSTRSTRSSSGSVRRSSSGSGSNNDVTTDTVAPDDSPSSDPEPTPKKDYSLEEVTKNISVVSGPGVTKYVKDNISGKTFSSVEELLKYYGFGAVDTPLPSVPFASINK